MTDEVKMSKCGAWVLKKIMDMNSRFKWVIVSCPKCTSTTLNIHHHPGSFAVPECEYIECEDCNHQWNHQ